MEGWEVDEFFLYALNVVNMQGIVASSQTHVLSSH